MRATFHNGRHATSPKHNDRDFNVTKANHIDPTKPCLIRFIENDINGAYETFDEQEQAFYKDNFSEHIANQNARMIELRNKKKCKTIENYRKSTKTCPEETIMQVGKWNNKTKQVESVPADELENMFWEFTEWHWEKYPQAVILNAAVHCDEPHAAPHIHMRKVWVSTDENGAKCVCQTKALQDMGVELPDPDKPVGRNNNLKMTYTAKYREKWEEIVKFHGYELEDRLDKSKTGLSHEQYIANQISEEIDEKHSDLNIRIRKYNEKTKALESEKSNR